MSGLGLEITPGARGIGISIPESHANDPVTNAVYNNLMGNIPKKSKTPTFCNVCNQEFSSQIVLDMHLAGSKHQRKITSIQLMKSLEQTESGFEKNLMTGVITCTICSVTVNSPQLLATHVAGNKHQTKKKGKRVNGNNQDGAPVKKRCTEDLSARKGTNCNVEIVQNSAISNDATEPISETDEKKIYPKKKERPLLDIVIPSCVTQLEENKTGGKFLCNPCGAHCNSDVQLQQHLESKKHFDKVSVKKNEIFSGSLGKGDTRWNQRGISRGKFDRGVRGNRRGGRLGRQNNELQSFKKFGEKDTGVWDGITEMTNNTGWTPDSSQGGKGNWGGRIDRGGKKATTTKWSSNLPSIIQNSNTSTSFSQKYNYDDSLIATSFSEGLGTSSLFGSTSDFGGFSRATGVNRPMRANRGRVAQVTSYYIKPDEMSPYRRAENSFGNINTEYPSRIANEYDLQETEGYSSQVTDFMSRKLEYHHNQSSSARGFDYDNNYVDTAHTATLEYDNNYGGNAYALGHNTRPPHGAISYAYTQPLSQNFVAGGSIM